MSKPERVAVVGGGYMGGGIAQSYAGHGIDCVLVDVSVERSWERVEQLHDEPRRFAADGLILDRMAEEIVATRGRPTALQWTPADSITEGET